MSTISEVEDETVHPHQNGNGQAVAAATAQAPPGPVAPVGNGPNNVEDAIHPIEIERILRNPMPPRPFVFDKVVMQGIVALVVAPGGTAKTLFFIHEAVFLAAGKSPWPSFQPSRAFRVVVFNGEDPQSILEERTKTIIEAHFPDPEDQRRIDENLRIYPTGPRKICTKVNGEFTEGPGYKLLADTIAHDEAEVVFLDPKSHFVGSAENNNADATALVNHLARIGRQSKVTVFLAHHASKSAGRSKNIAAGISRGASALTDGVRLVMNLYRPESDDAGQGDELFLNLAITKNNYGETFGAPRVFRQNGCVLTELKDAPVEHLSEKLVAYVRELGGLHRDRFLFNRHGQGQDLIEGFRKCADRSLSQSERQRLVAECIDRKVVTIEKRGRIKYLTANDATPAVSDTEVGEQTVTENVGCATLAKSLGEEDETPPASSSTEPVPRAAGDLEHPVVDAVPDGTQLSSPATIEADSRPKGLEASASTNAASTDAVSRQAPAKRKAGRPRSQQRAEEDPR